MAKTITQRELRDDNARVIEAVAAGASFVVTRDGVPVAELHPTRRTFVPRLRFWRSRAPGHGSTERASERISIGSWTRAKGMMLDTRNPDDCADLGGHFT